MKKGIVMSIEGSYLTLLTPDGEFLKAKKQENVMLGEEIVFFPINETLPTRSSLWEKIRMKKAVMASISALAMIVLLLSFIPMLLTSKEAYAYVSIDINPSLEIAVDEVLNVISIKAFNEEGEDLLNNIPEWKKQHIDTVTTNIINKSIESGYYHEGNEILIATVINEENGTVKDELQKDLENVVATYKEDKKIEVTTIESNVEMRDKAKQQGVSTGKLIQMEKKAQKELVDTEKEEEMVEKEIEESQEAPSKQESTDKKENLKQNEDVKENKASEKTIEKGKEFGQNKASEKGKANSETKGNRQKKNENETARPNHQKIPSEVKKHVEENLKRAAERSNKKNDNDNE